MTAQSFANNFTTQLNGGISSGAATLVVQSASGSPPSGSFTIMVYVQNANGTISNSELMLVTAGQGTVNWTVLRGQEGTAAVSHSNGEQVSQMWTLAGLNSLGQGFWPTLAPSGITGATQPSRYVGATAGGPPVTGTFVVGDWCNDPVYGVFWTCTTAGSPGSWKPSGPVPIFDSTLSVAASSITVTIPSTFAGSSLELDLSLRSTAAANLDAVDAQFNGNTTGTAYFTVTVGGNGTTATSSTALGGNVAGVSTIPAANVVPSLIFGSARMIVPNYAAAADAVSWSAYGGVLGPQNLVGVNTGVWVNGGPLTSILFTTQSGSTFTAGSRISARVLS